MCRWHNGSRAIFLILLTGCNKTETGPRDAILADLRRAHNLIASQQQSAAALPSETEVRAMLGPLLTAAGPGRYSVDVRVQKTSYTISVRPESRTSAITKILTLKPDGIYEQDPSLPADTETRIEILN